MSMAAQTPAMASGTPNAKRLNHGMSPMTTPQKANALRFLVLQAVHSSANTMITMGNPINVGRCGNRCPITGFSIQ